MAFRIVTGRAGKPHVSSADMGSLFALTKGDGRYKLDDITCSIIDANTVKVSGGNLLLDGRHFVNSSEGENLAIANGSQGRNRIDLVVVRYRYIAQGDKYTETGELAVIQGTSTDGEPVRPECAGGSILNDDHLVEIPLFEVRIEGIAITDVSDCLLGDYELPAKYGGTGVAVELIHGVQGAVDTALAAASAANIAAQQVHIANAMNAASEEAIDQLATQLAAKLGDYLVVGSTIYVPQSKASFSGTELTFYTGSFDEETGAVTLA